MIRRTGCARGTAQGLGSFREQGFKELTGWAWSTAQGLRRLAEHVKTELSGSSRGEVAALLAAAAPLTSTPEAGMALYMEPARK